MSCYTLSNIMNPHVLLISPSPNDTFLGWSKLKAFPDEKITKTEKLKFVLDRIENIVEKGENAAFPTMFSKGFFPRVVKIRDCVVRG